MNRDLQRKNNKLADYIKNKTMKYKSNAKDSINRIKIVKQKLQEYEGLNSSVFETLEEQERILEVRNISEIDDKTSLFSHGSDLSPIAIGGVQEVENLHSFGNEDEVIEATGSSSQHKRSKSRPYMYKQQSDNRKEQLERLEKNLQDINRRSPSFSTVNSKTMDPKNFKSKFGPKEGILNMISRPSQAEISDIRFPSERK